MCSKNIQSFLAGAYIDFVTHLLCYFLSEEGGFSILATLSFASTKKENMDAPLKKFANFVFQDGDKQYIDISLTQKYSNI